MELMWQLIANTTSKWLLDEIEIDLLLGRTEFFQVELTDLDCERLEGFVEEKKFSLTFGEN